MNETDTRICAVARSHADVGAGLKAKAQSL
jgi:hypothetical protein